MGPGCGEVRFAVSPTLGEPTTPGVAMKAVAASNATAVTETNPSSKPLSSTYLGTRGKMWKEWHTMHNKALTSAVGNQVPSQSFKLQPCICTFRQSDTMHATPGKGRHPNAPKKLPAANAKAPYSRPKTMHSHPQPCIRPATHTHTHTRIISCTRHGPDLTAAIRHPPRNNSEAFWGP